MQTVYAFMYNPCYHESVAKVVSLHFKKADAYRAMREKKFSDYEEWYNNRHQYCSPSATDKYPEWEWYGVLEMVVT